VRSRRAAVLVAPAALLAAGSAALAQDAHPDAPHVRRDSGQNSLPVLANDDAGSAGSRLSILSVTPPSHGTLSIAPGGLGLLYTPAAGYVGPDSFSYTATNAFQVLNVPRQTLAVVGGTPIFDGYGSANAPVPGKTDEFYVMTDRGPNVDGPSGGKVFPMATFTPTIARYKIVDGALVLQETILMKDAAGHPRTGLPNPVGAGGTGEVPYDENGNLLPPDPNGLDSEGLVALADGTFWVSDEYGPYMTHFAHDGTTIEQIAPFSVDALGHKLPTCLKFRIINKGMEGLTITPDGKKLVGLMQSPLANMITESDAGKSSPLRVVTFDLTTGATQQFIYLVDDPKFTCSEITAVSNTDFLADERDGKFPGDPAGASVQKRVYRFSLVGATDVSDPADGTNGKLFSGKSLELLTTKQNAATCRATLLANGVTCVTKSLFVDLIAEANSIGMLGTLYPHDKVEGISLVDAGRRLVFSNDDDFGVTAGPTIFSVVPKIIPTLPAGTADFTQLLFVDLTNLPASSHVTSAVVNVTVVGPEGALKDLLASLSAFEPDQHRLDVAIQHLTAALSPNPFTDELHLSGKGDKGEKLFAELHVVLEQLRILAANHGSDVDDATIAAWIDAAVWSARQSASVAIADASGLSARDLASAQADLAQGDADAASGDPVGAVDDCRRAWRTATK
jgi:hypothetical protein